MKKSSKVLLYVFWFGLRDVGNLYSQAVIQRTIDVSPAFFGAQFGGKEHMQTVIETSRKLDSFLHDAAQNFELLSSIQDKKNPIAVDVLFKAYPMVPLSCRSNLVDGTFKFIFCRLRCWV